MYPTPNRSSSEVDKGNQDTNLISSIILQGSSCRVLTKVVCGLGGLRVFQIPEKKYHIFLDGGNWQQGIFLVRKKLLYRTLLYISVFYHDHKGTSLKILYQANKLGSTIKVLRSRSRTLSGSIEFLLILLFFSAVRSQYHHIGHHYKQHEILCITN